MDTSQIERKEEMKSRLTFGSNCEASLNITAASRPVEPREPGDAMLCFRRVSSSIIR
jgi:hypothetical protein